MRRRQTRKFLAGGEWPEKPSLRALVYWSFRRGDLCSGERECPEAVEVSCLDCALDWTPDDIDAPGACPSCEARRYRRAGCPACPLLKIDGCEGTQAGHLLQRAVDLKCALKAGVEIGLADIPEDEFRALLIVEQERERYEAESVKNNR